LTTAQSGYLSGTVWAVALGRTLILDLLLKATGAGLDFKWATKVCE
jgi:hypothetical protein